MGTPFFYNENIPIDGPDFKPLLANCFRLYLKEIWDYPVRGIFHTLGKNVDWLSKLEEIKDHDLRSRAHVLVTRTEASPISDEELLDCKGSTQVDDVLYENPYGHIAAFLTEGFLFTVPVTESFKKDFLPFFDKDKNEKSLRNFHGDNIAFVLNELEERRKNGLSLLEKLQEELAAQWHSCFEKNFNKQAKNLQEKIFCCFKKEEDGGYKAKKKGEGTKNMGALSQGGVLYALKIFNPRSLRIYFTLYNSKPLIASLCLKNPDKEQDQDIKAAKRLLDKLIVKQQNL